MRRHRAAQEGAVARRAGQQGAGLLGTLFGVAAVIVMVGVAANVALGLWARSTIDAAAYDAARRVASTPAGADAADRARRAASDTRARLGATGRSVELTFETLGPPDVVLRVRAPGVSLLPRIVSAPVVGSLDRRIVIRREVDRP